MTFKHLLLLASLALNVLLFWALVWGGEGLVAYRGMEAELALLNERSEALRQKNIELSQEIKLLESDNRYIEQMIRNRLNFIKDNEIWYIFPNKGEPEGANETEN